MVRARAGGVGKFPSEGSLFRTTKSVSASRLGIG
jgi:hypothetical protein